MKSLNFSPVGNYFDTEKKSAHPKNAEKTSKF